MDFLKLFLDQVFQSEMMEQITDDLATPDVEQYQQKLAVLTTKYVGLPSEDQLLKLVRFQDAVAAEELQGQEEGPVLADVVATAYEGHQLDEGQQTQAKVEMEVVVEKCLCEYLQNCHLSDQC